MARLVTLACLYDWTLVPEINITIVFMTHYGLKTLETLDPPPTPERRGELVTRGEHTIKTQKYHSISL